MQQGFHTFTSIRGPTFSDRISTTAEYVAELREAIKKYTPLLEEMSDEATLRRPGPGKWCPREIIGHLIDSASNNRQRFVRAQLQDDRMVDYGGHLRHHLGQIELN